MRFYRVVCLALAAIGCAHPATGPETKAHRTNSSKTPEVFSTTTPPTGAYDFLFGMSPGQAEAQCGALHHTWKRVTKNWWCVPTAPDRGDEVMFEFCDDGLCAIVVGEHAEPLQAPQAWDAAYAKLEQFYGSPGERIRDVPDSCSASTAAMYSCLESDTAHLGAVWLWAGGEFSVALQLKAQNNRVAVLIQHLTRSAVNRIVGEDH